MKPHHIYSLAPAQWPIRKIATQQAKKQLLPDSYLTKREIEIIKLLSEEHDSGEVADLLFISRNTVDTHRKNIMKKINVKSVVGIVRYAFKYGLVEV